MPSITITTLSGLSITYSTLTSLYTMFLHLKNYRRPQLQRLILRIFWMVPVYSISSFASLLAASQETGSSFRGESTGNDLSSTIDTIRDVYEAFVIYSFFALLINYLDGERNLLLILSERTRIHHLWPFHYFLNPMDMSDPETFLFLRRGVLQFVVIKPILAICVLGLKGMGWYREGEVSWSSLYVYTSSVYNASVCWSMYCLVLFYVQCSQDLKPYRPLPKFICVKSIIFLTFWQSLFVAFLGWTGALTPDKDNASPSKQANLVQQLLLCFEMPLFSHLHYYAFPWTDYDDSRLSSRLYLSAALKDALGVKDLVVDVYKTLFEMPSKDELRKTYPGRPPKHSGLSWDDGMQGHAYTQEDQDEEDFGETKSLLPAKGPRQSSSKSYLISNYGGAGSSTHGTLRSHRPPSRSYPPTESDAVSETYSTVEGDISFAEDLDPTEEQDYLIARGLVYGDYNFPVVHEDERFRHPPAVQSILAEHYHRFVESVEAATVAATANTSGTRSRNTTGQQSQKNQNRKRQQEGDADQEEIWIID